MLYLVIIIAIICVLNILIVAFFTLFERLILASMQIRKGPNVVGLLGLAQPIADALKLLLKEMIIPKKANNFIFILVPAFMLWFSLCLWSLFPLSDTNFIILPSLTFLFTLLFSSMNALLVILVGWSANSKYAFQGALRCISQMVSYELPFMLILLDLFLLYGTLEIPKIIFIQEYAWGIWNFLCFIIFFLTALGETNRTPFDLVEAESELVSGYHTEHGSILFTYMFLGEYCYIVIISNIIVILFLGGWTNFISFYFYLIESCYFFTFVFLYPYFFNIWIFYALKLLFILYCFIWIRATLPRYRYDQLMYLGWTMLLPISIGILTIDYSYIYFLNAISTYFFYW